MTCVRFCRTARHWSVLGLAVCIALSTSNATYAAPKKSKDQERLEALDSIERANKSLADGAQDTKKRYDEACSTIFKLQESYNDFVFRIKVAGCLRHTGKHWDSWLLYRAIEKDSAVMYPDIMREAADKGNQLLKQLPRIRFLGPRCDDLQVFVDGVLLEERDVLAGYPVEGGTYTVRLKAPRCVESLKVVTVGKEAGSTAQVDISLQPKLPDVDSTGAVRKERMIEGGISANFLVLPSDLLAVPGEPQNLRPENANGDKEAISCALDNGCIYTSTSAPKLHVAPAIFISTGYSYWKFEIGARLTVEIPLTGGFGVSLSPEFLFRPIDRVRFGIAPLFGYSSLRFTTSESQPRFLHPSRGVLLTDEKVDLAAEATFVGLSLELKLRLIKGFWLGVQPAYISVNSGRTSGAWMLSIPVSYQYTVPHL